MTWLGNPAWPRVCLLLLCAAAPQAREPPEPVGAEAAEAAAQARLAAQQRAAAQARSDADAATEQLLATTRVAAASRLRDAEQHLADVAQRVADLARRHAADAQIRHQTRMLAPLLPVMLRMSAYPAETLLAAPSGSPADALRGLLVMGEAVRRLRDQVQALARHRAELAALQTQLDAALPDLRAAQAVQRAQAEALDESLARARQTRQASRAAADAAAQRAAAEAARARDLQSAVAAVAAAPRPRPDSAAKGLLVPVAGPVVHNFGEALDTGPAGGLTYQAPPGARVVAPCAGQVAFAAPFRSYGLLIIIDCGGSAHVVLAGLGRLDARAGQAVRRGEPVGVMPDWDPTDTARAHPGLYVELRHGSEAVDPTPYLRSFP
jgi:septal ring factor EnvC (AmiA/AmiB activator)